MLSSCRAAAGRHVATTLTRACSSLALGLGYPSTGSLKPASDFNELMDGGTRDTHTSTQVRILDLSVIAGLPLALPGAWPLQELPDTKSAISPHDALGPDEMRPLMDALGITLDSTVVLTDPFGLMPSARLWWLLKAYGLRDVWVLPGGHRGVEGLAPPSHPAAALKVARDLAATREAAAALPGPTELYWPSSDWARLAGGAPEGSQVLDVRSAAEFEGVDLRGNPVGGHIPGALCVPHTEFCDMTPGDGGAPTLRPAEEVLALLGEAGLAPPGNAPPIITVCQSGMRSSLATLVLTSLGYSVRNYEAGMGHFLSRPAP